MQVEPFRRKEFPEFFVNEGFADNEVLKIFEDTKGKNLVFIFEWKTSVKFFQ